MHIRRLLHIEQVKLLNYNPFRITIALYFVFFALGILIYPAIDKEVPVISLSDLFRFPDVWLFLTWITEPYNAMLALIIIMITTKEFNNHTFKTQVIFGLSRSELLLQKMLLIVVLSLFAALLVGLTSMVLGLIYSYKLTFKIAMQNTWILGRYLMAAFSYMCMGLIIALLIKNTALSLLTFLALRVFVDPVLWLILREHEIKWYLPFRSITRLTPVPDLIEIFQRKMNSSEPIDDATLELLPKGLTPWLNILMVLLYTGLVIFFSYRLMQRRRFT
jgi:ABC-type transport system involved in multi-copper enzyme maturation permease subunit